MQSNLLGLQDEGLVRLAVLDLRGRSLRHHASLRAQAQLLDEAALRLRPGLSLLQLSWHPCEGPALFRCMMGVDVCVCVCVRFWWGFFGGGGGGGGIAGGPSPLSLPQGDQGSCLLGGFFPLCQADVQCTAWACECEHAGATFRMRSCLHVFRVQGLGIEVYIFMLGCDLASHANVCPVRPCGCGQDPALLLLCCEMRATQDLWPDPTIRTAALNKPCSGGTRGLCVTMIEYISVGWGSTLHACHQAA